MLLIDRRGWRRKGRLDGTAARQSAVAAAAALVVTGASAQLIPEVGGTTTEAGRTYYLNGDLTIRETLTDNARQVAGGQEWDLITEIEPSIRWGVRNRWARLSISYSINAIVYARASDLNDVQQTLSIGAGASDTASFELIPDRLFLNVGGDISQRVADPFGQRPPSGNRTNENLEQVASYFVNPYLVGNLGPLAQYRLDVRHAASSEANSFEFNRWTNAVAASVFSAPGFRRLGWSVNGSRTIDYFDDGRRTDQAALTAGVSYLVVPELTVRASAGSDWNNFESENQQRYDRYGAGFDWRPNVRTSVSAFVEDRFFGTGYNVLARYNAGRSTWTYTAVRDVSDARGSFIGVTGSAYDLFFQQFEAIEPYPLLREQLVLDFLSQNNIPRDAQVTSEFIYYSASLREEHRFAVAYRATPRTTFTASAFLRDTSRIDEVSNADDIFTDSDFVRERGVLFTASHRLTPLSSAGLRLSETRTTGQFDDQSTRQREASIRWSTRLNPSMTFSVVGRHTNFDSATDPYTENELEAVLNIRLF
ncbi:MAG: TIGR03016 family PEP-CTERM system-associated outer membrane protein [Rubrivivax sp.]|nr:TIGR03016 family PEP-CTERM system-associated outer membrane protein [Rubrivivax sp.]